MSRIIHPEEGLPFSPFQEASLGDVPATATTPTLDDELVSPEDLLDRARAEAHAIIAAAREEAANIRATAEAEGRAAGEAAGAAEGAAEYRTMTETLRAVADAVQAEHARVNAELVDGVVEVALAVVKRILGDLVAADPEVMRHVVAEALVAAGQHESVAIHVHPSVVDVVERERDALREAFPGTGALTVVADDLVAPGGCLLDTRRVQLDATVEAVIARLRAQAAPAAGTITPPIRDAAEDT